MSKCAAVAFYARVSSETQARDHTIDSQIAVLKQRIAADGFQLEPDHGYVDDGCSGTNLQRPALEKLRDAVAAWHAGVGCARSAELARGVPASAADGLQKPARFDTLERNNDRRHADQSGLHRTRRARAVAGRARRTAVAFDAAQFASRAECDAAHPRAARGMD